MKGKAAWLVPMALASAVVLSALAAARVPETPHLQIQVAADSPALVQLAGREIRRYTYLRTGELLPVVAGPAQGGDVIIIACKNEASVRESANAELRAKAGSLGEQQFLLRTISTGRGKTLWIIGGDPQGALYGAYRYIETLGVRFYLHGDVVPEEKTRCALGDLDETGKPLFSLRGLNPWGSHPFGFDAWGTDDYKAVFTQLAKMRMNFLGIHCYPEGAPYAEPTVWLGTREDFDAQGRVRFSYPSHYYNTLVKGVWGPILPKKTGDYSFGGALLFEDDAWAPEVMRGHCPAPETPEASNEVFNRMVAQFHDAFGFAHRLGVKTCLGTETPLVMPKALQERLKAVGKDPQAPATVREVYEGMFRRIKASHPLDYFWLWTPEGWTWEGNQAQAYTNTVADVKLAIEALKQSGAPFKLATCGWVLGPQHDRAAFDHDLPKDIPMGAISRQLGYTPVDPAFGRIRGREKWAIPWLESDGRHGLAAVQLFVGRTRRDAADALGYGCTGLMGLQWRTDILAPNAAALAQAAWGQAGWNPSPGQPQAAAAPAGPAGSPEQKRDLPCDDFYADWARANFGSAAGGGIARVFAAVDGRLPVSVGDGCPSGSLQADPTPWAKVAANYAFVSELEQMRRAVQGAGNLARFDWWLNTFRYHRSLHRVRCALGEFNALWQSKKPEAARAKYEELVSLYGETYRLLLATVNSPGGLASVVNLENHAQFWPVVVEAPARTLGLPVPRLPQTFAGQPRIIVPTVRSLVCQGERLEVKFIVLDRQPPKSVTLAWRPLGTGPFRNLSAQHVARAVYRVELPEAAGDFEYYLEAETVAGNTVTWPVTAPAQNQSVVVLNVEH